MIIDDIRKKSARYDVLGELLVYKNEETSRLNSDHILKSLSDFPEEHRDLIVDAVFGALVHFVVQRHSESMNLLESNWKVRQIFIKASEQAVEELRVR